jgi:HK97 family phage prohead protease
MASKLEGVRRAAYSMPWMMQLEKLEAVLDLVDIRASGVVLSEEEAAARIGERRAAEPRLVGTVAVLPFYGVVAQRMNVMERISGGTSTELFGRDFEAAVEDEAVTAIVIDVHSPGGSVYGTPELARKIFASRGKKPIIGIANALAASAGYYVLAACETVVVTPSGEVGSIGVYMAHDDLHIMAHEAGVKRTYIFAGEHKVDGNPYQPLSPETRAYWQEQVDDMYAMFVGDVARFRGVSTKEVLANFGQARTLLAGRAVAAGLADRVATLDEILDELTPEDLPQDDEAPPEPPLVILPGEDDDCEDGPTEQLVRAEVPQDAETRDLQGEARTAETADRPERLEGVGVRFNTPSALIRGGGREWREEFTDGSFAESLASDDVRVIWQHDPAHVLGRVKAGTARVWEADGALRYEATPPEAQWARDAMASVRRGDVDQNSFTFVALEQKWERRGADVFRVISKAKLYEVGPQTFPANPDTSVAVAELVFAGIGGETQAAGELEIRRRRAQIAALDV